MKKKKHSFIAGIYRKERQKLIVFLNEIHYREQTDSFDERVKLIEYDPDGENKIIAGLLYPLVKKNFLKTFSKVKRLSLKQKEKLLAEILKDRRWRWQKVPRAFENIYVRWEIITNIGAWRDIQRHRMHTQYHQKFNIYLGYDIPAEFENIKDLKTKFILTINKLEKLYKKIEKIDSELAQYATSFAHRVRFIQYQNLRQVFWETELRTISQGHSDYRHIEQIKAKKIRDVYPLIGKYLLIDFKNYDFARRGTEEKIAAKLAKLKK